MKKNDSAEKKAEGKEEQHGCCGGGCCGHENKQNNEKTKSHAFQDMKANNQEQVKANEHCCKDQSGIEANQTCCDKDSSVEEELQANVNELTDTLQRLQAEFENYKKRLAKESSTLVASANQALVKELLPVLDNFELALSNKGQDQNYMQGVKLIFSQLKNILDENGLEEIQAVGKKFDPYYHEALMAEESNREPGIVLEQIQKGYLFNGSILRHAKVKVSKKPSKETKDDDSKLEEGTI